MQNNNRIFLRLNFFNSIVYIYFVSYSISEQLNNFLWFHLFLTRTQFSINLEIEGIEGFFVRKVTKFGNSAKVDCPKEYLGRTVYLVIV